jgi:hypothetical protein
MAISGKFAPGSSMPVRFNIDYKYNSLTKFLKMILADRAALMVKLGQYLQSGDEAWLNARHRASIVNSWFTPEFIDIAVRNIYNKFLAGETLRAWLDNYQLPDKLDSPMKIGIVMAGNIPLAGFHDLLCVFLSGHKALIKPSSKDEVLVKHIVQKLIEWDTRVKDYISIAERLNNCGAYIATGSNNTSRYFEYYFGKYPHIIRRNRSSAAILSGNESLPELELLADDICLFFGLGCRNITKIYVPGGYDFAPLLAALKKYGYLEEHHKYKNNYDYNLAIHILDQKFYMTNGSTLIVEDPSLFSPISQLHFEYYEDAVEVRESLQNSGHVQCIVGLHGLPFGQAQQPGLSDYADTVDTMAFLKTL